jgi:hypothetical protein
MGLSEKFKRLDKPFMDAPGLNAESKPDNRERIRMLQQQIADLKKQWPAHSTPPGMMLRLDELEEELANELAKTSQS